MADRRASDERKKRSGCNREKERAWRERLIEHRESGLSIREYCRRCGFSETVFHWWKRKIRKRDAENIENLHRDTYSKWDAGFGQDEEGGQIPGLDTLPSREKPVESDDKNDKAGSGPAFAELRLTEGDTPAASHLPENPATAETSSKPCRSDSSTEHAGIDIVLTNGRLVRVRRPFDPALFLEVLGLLECEATSC